MKKPIYSALFVVSKSKLIERFRPKYNNIFCHHSTIEFGDVDLTKITLGKKYKIKVLAIARDENADAVIVENLKSSNEYPHITLSCKDGINPVYSNKLIENCVENDTIEYLDEPFEIEIVEGYFDGADRIK